VEIDMNIHEPTDDSKRPEAALPMLGDIRIYSRANCPFCGSPGQPLYDGIQDYQFGVPGTWNFKRCLDRGCGMIWLDPVPAEQDVARLYSDMDYFGHRETQGRAKRRSLIRELRDMAGLGYLELRWGYRSPNAGRFSRFAGYLIYSDPVKRLALDHSVMFLPAHNHGRLIEIGCGDGEFLARARSLGWQVEGIDFDARSVEMAKRKGIPVTCGTPGEQNLRANSYDAIVLCHLIEHVHDPRTLLRDCYRILRPGGQLVVLTPNAQSLSHRIFRKCWLPLDPPRHLQIFNPVNLPRLVRQTGFEVLECSTDASMSRVAFVAGRVLQQTGHYDPWQPWSVKQKLECLAWELLQMVLGTVTHQIGETLRVIASKPGRPIRVSKTYQAAVQ
jgi:SAM-dependent methyltransferase